MMRRTRETAVGHPRKDPLLLGISGALLLCGAGLLAYVARTMRDGFLDARPRHARDMEPILLRAADEPFWFYGIIAGVTVLAVHLLVLGVRMLRQALRRP
ncbi:hypothetical protein [Longimicrobium sp.]|uniref:hypothetical protein n=1 Tax=Longimicrobium sp. TaxID=2029185 RepID=UPI002E3473BD|nr:hypothetical protein [Longimicrobium sp.]HEX6038248.1 hypothetical protein [Longimicrobium sp.]